MQQLSSKQINKKPSKQPIPIEIQPKKLSFSQFQVSKTHVNKFTIRNKSERKQTLKIFGLDRDDPAFTISYDQKRVIESKEEVDVFVYFKPQEDRFYSQNLEIMLGNTYNKVQLTAFSMINHKRTSKLPRILNKDSKEKRVIEISSGSSLDVSNEDVETEFLRRCNQLANHRVQKSIKSQSCVGNQALSTLEIKEIQDKRVEIIQNKFKQRQTKIKTRYTLQVSKKCPIHDRGSNKIVKWDQSKNNLSMMIKYSLKKFQSEIMKMVIDDRFDRVRRILVSYMELDVSKEEVFRRIQQDTKQTLREKVKWKKGERMLVEPNLQFGKFSIQSQAVPSQYDNLSSIRTYLFDVDPRISFDDWIPIPETLENGYQIMNYQNIQESAIIMHQPVVDISFREGAQEEYPFVSNMFAQSPYPQYYEVEELPYQEFKPNLFFETATQDVMEDFQCTQDQETHQNYYQKSQLFNGLNYQVFNYIKDDTSSKYDIGFHNQIQSACDTLIGGVTLEDKIDQDVVLDARFSRVDNSLILKLKSLEVPRQQQLSPNQILSNISLSMGEMKRQRAGVSNTFFKSCNSVTRSVQHKISF